VLVLVLAQEAPRVVVVVAVGVAVVARRAATRDGREEATANGRIVAAIAISFPRAMRRARTRRADQCPRRG
jgi:hypothetical protein|tara:strand:- start:210 stop:422 length:213 start_codon:yes stop_codon:yes gene_type:complete